MIIEHVPVDGKESNTNTDKLPDVDALILEKAEELRKICLDYSRQCVIVVDAKGKENGTGTMFWNMRMKGDPAEIATEEDKEKTNKAFNNIMNMVQGFVLSMTGGRVGLAVIDGAQSNENAE